jgi:hypothetical protein
LPQLNLKMGLGALVFGQSLTRFSLRQADVVLDLHMRQRRNSTLTPEQRAARRKAIADSLAMAAPGAPGGMLSVDMDSGNRRMLRRWDFNGHIKAKSGRVVTPYFPLRNRISNIDLHFSQDSIQLHNLSYQAGQSDFLVNGTISNLRRASQQHARCVIDNGKRHYQRQRNCKGAVRRRLCGTASRFGDDMG